MPLKRVTLSGRYLSAEDKNSDWWRTVFIGGFLAVVDVILALGTGFAVYKTFKGYALFPIERGFYCHDELIRYSWKPNSVTTTQLIVVVMGTAPLIIALFETLLFRTAQGENMFPKWIRSCTFQFLKFIIGFSTCISVMEIFKCLFGRLRPYFLESCQPDWTRIDCKTNPRAYIADAFCTGDALRVRNARTSFPSGHSAAAVFFAAYFVLYTIKLSKSGYTRFMQFVAAITCVSVVSWTAYVLVTRVTDNRHFVSDVVAGSCLGILFTILTNAVFSRSHVYEERDILRKVKFE